MTSAAEHRRPLPTDSEAILNALPNPVLLVAPDGRIVDAKTILLLQYLALHPAQ